MFSRESLHNFYLSTYCLGTLVPFFKLNGDSREMTGNGKRERKGWGTKCNKGP